MLSCHATLNSVIINLLFVFSGTFLTFYLKCCFLFTRMLVSSVSEESYISLCQMSESSGLDTHPVEPSKATTGRDQHSEQTRII